MLGLDVGRSRGHHGLRLPAQHVEHDRQVVRRQVPDHVHVVLEQAQVDPHGVVVVDLAQRAVVDEMLHLADGPREQEGVVHHDPEVFPLGQVDELLGLGDGVGEGLLDKDVLAGLEGLFGQLEVGEDGRDDGHGVDVRGPDQLVGIFRGPHTPVVLLDLLQGVVPEIAHGHHGGPVHGAEVADNVRPPVAVTDNAQP